MVYYEYDGFGRLTRVIEHDGNVASHGDASHGDGEFDTFFLFVQWEKRIRFAKKINRYGKKGENS